MAVIAVGIVALLFWGAIFVLHRSETRSLDTAITVRLKRHRGGFVAELTQLGADRPLPTEHGVAWLGDRNQARAGDPLWIEQLPRFQPMTVLFTQKRDGVPHLPAAAGKRAIRLADDEGGGAWMRWTAGSDATGSESLVILWTLERRRRGLSPVILRGSQAEAWVDHFQKSASQPPEPPAVGPAPSRF